MKTTRRNLLIAGALLVPALLAAPAVQAQTGPLRIGSTLALTGPLGATAVMQKIAGEIYIEQLNKRGGLLGRQVEWIKGPKPPRRKWTELNAQFVEWERKEHQAQYPDAHIP